MQKVLLRCQMSDIRRQTSDEKNKKNVSMIIDPHKQMTKCKRKKEFLKNEKKNDRTDDDGRERKNLFLKFVVRLWDDDDDEHHHQPCRTPTPLRILLGCTRPRRKECPVDDDDRTTRTTARYEYKFSVARLFFSMRRNFRSRLVF